MNKRVLMLVLATAATGSWLWWRWRMPPYTVAPALTIEPGDVEAENGSHASPPTHSVDRSSAGQPSVEPRAVKSSGPVDVSPTYDAAFPEREAPSATHSREARQLDVVTEQVVLGEQAFVEGDLEAAFDHFSSVVENEPDHPKAPFALYRLAWVEHKMGEHEHALEDMTEAVEWATVQNDGSQASRWLLQQVERDLETLQLELDAALPTDEP